MDILYVGDVSRSARSRMILDAMRDLGHKVEPVPTQPLDERGEGIADRSVLRRVQWKLGFPPDSTGVNRQVQRRLQEVRYDLLWVGKALMLRPEILLLARRLQPDIRLVFSSEDDMYARHNQSRYFLSCLGLFDVVFTTKSYNCRPEELSSLGAKRVVFVDQCFDKHRHKPIEITAQVRERFGAAVGFIGTFEEDRAVQMLYLAERGVSVRVWGSAWPKHWMNRHQNLRVEGNPLLGDDYVNAICSTAINLCFLRKANRDLQTSRSVEIPACGAFMLAERSIEHRRLFKEGKEAEFFQSREELLAKVHYYTEHLEARLRIAAAARARCLRDGYSFSDRLSSMFSLFTADR